MFKYDVSVIIPAYNGEKYIEESIQSVIKQKYKNSNLIQIIVVNDGSKDRTKEIVEKLAEQYSNVVLINKENSGVSESRNIGLKRAEGKYILFLDSDDLLEESSVQRLVNFFEEHYDEIDMVTYPMRIYDNEKAKPKQHYRYKFYDRGTGIYDLEENPYLGQSTINTMIKNMGENRVLFDKEMDYSEDEAFNTTILMKKKKIGFCQEATYIYRKNVNSVTKNKSNPYYTFESLTKYNENLIDRFQDENGRIPKYIQAIILNNFRWRIKQDELYPYHYTKENFDRAMARLKNILGYIELDTIINMPNMDKYHKFYIINLKECKVCANINKKSFNICADSVLLDQGKCVTIKINKFKCIGNRLEVLGYIRASILLYKEFKLFYKVIDTNGQMTKKCIDTFDSNFCRYGTKMNVTKIFAFDMEIDISNVQSFSFEIEIEHNVFNVNYEFSNFVPFNNFFRSFITNKKIISYNKNDRLFRIRKATIFRELETKLKKNYILLKNKKIKAIIYRLCSKIYTGKKIWLYCDRDGVFDNSYYQFMHDVNKKDTVKRYYVYDDKFEDIKDRFENVSKRRMVKYGTIKHKLLYLASSKVLTSFQAMSYYNPLGSNMKSYRDILKYDLIYLQHGILHCHTPWIFSNEKNEIEKVVVSSQYEVNNFIRNYNYMDKNLIKSGMPRLDFIDVNTTSENRIVYAPTWRKHLIGDLDSNNRRILKKERFINSDYYKKIDALLNSQHLIKMLEEKNMYFEFKIHPVFRDYIDLFKVKSKNIIVNADEIKLDNYKLFITDYSSYVFDYVYLKRPIVYFLPDEIEFNAGLHIYRKLDLPLEEAFGDITHTTEELINKIELFINNDFKLETKYKKRMDTFFFDIPNRREKIYDELVK